MRPTALASAGGGNDPNAKLALKMLDRLDEYLSATQLGITLSSLGLGWVGEPALANMLEGPLRDLGLGPTAIHATAFAIGFGVLSVFHIVLGELVPKSLAIATPVQVSRLSARTLRVFYILTWPALVALNGLSIAILRALSLPTPGKSHKGFSADEIRLIISASFTDARSRSRTRELLERVLQGTERHVRALMVPRVDMVTVDSSATVESFLATIQEHGFSRFPLCANNDPDEIEGYVYAKDVLRHSSDLQKPLSNLKRDPLFVPESRTVGELLSEFQVTKTHFAIVVDEYGGTSGLVTLEDVVEEIVGEIQDEHDRERSRILKLPGGGYILDGSVPRDEIHIDGLALEGHDEADTLGGFVVGALGRLARPGDQVEAGKFAIKVKDIRRMRVSEVELLPLPGYKEEEE